MKIYHLIHIVFKDSFIVDKEFGDTILNTKSKKLTEN